MIHSSTVMPNFALKGALLTTDQLAGTGITDPHMFLIAIPKMMPLGYGKQWIKGPLDETETLDLFEAKYGSQRGKWLYIIKLAIDQSRVISTID